MGATERHFTRIDFSLAFKESVLFSTRVRNEENNAALVSRKLFIAYKNFNEFYNESLSLRLNNKTALK
jgi:hypothetical protein